MPMQSAAELLTGVSVVPVLTLDRVADAVPLARALVAGGLTVLEVTLRTEVALDAVKRLIAEVPDAVIGIGTITSEPDVRLALASGARFLVTPGTPPSLASALRQSPVPVMPGCGTVSEAMALAALGFSVPKFFPAATSGGIGFLKAIAAPLPAIKFCPSGGIDHRNAPDYLALPNVIAVGGSWVAPNDAVQRGDFARIETLAAEAAALRR